MTVTVSRIFVGYDQGHYSLPDQVLEARRGAEFLRGTLREMPSVFTGDVALEEKMVVEVRTNAGSETLPSFDELFEAIDARPREQARRRILQRAAREASERIADVVAGAAEEIVIDHLRPALEKVMTQATGAAGKLQGRPLEITDTAMLSATKGEQDAWLAVKELGSRYAAIRGGQGALTNIGYRPQNDDRFGEFENFDDLWPHRGSWTAGAQQPPWPGDPANRLLWIIRGEARPWMPTVEEQDAAYAAFIPRNKERVSRQLAGNRAPNMYA